MREMLVTPHNCVEFLGLTAVSSLDRRVSLFSGGTH